jgi:hypothetical protein
MSAMLSIGQYRERPLKPFGCPYVGRIQNSRQRILDKGDTNAVKILNDQEVFSTDHLSQKLIEVDVAHAWLIWPGLHTFPR